MQRVHGYSSLARVQRQPAGETISVLASSQHNRPKTMATCHYLFTKNIHTNYKMKENTLLPLITVSFDSYHFLQVGSSLALPISRSCSLSLLCFPCSCYCSLCPCLFSVTLVILFFQLLFNSSYVFKGIIYLIMRIGPDFSQQDPGTCTKIRS